MIHVTMLQRLNRLQKGIERHIVHVEAIVKVPIYTDSTGKTVEAKECDQREYFREFFKGQNSIEVILNAVDPHTGVKLKNDSNKTYFSLDGKLDDAQSFDELSIFEPPFRLIKMLRSIGSERFVNKAQAEKGVARDLAFLR